MLNKQIIAKVLLRKEFADNPPVLLDIGASGKTYEPWNEIAKYSICVAFDADAREIKHIEDGSGYKKYTFITKLSLRLTIREYFIDKISLLFKPV